MIDFSAHLLQYISLGFLFVASISFVPFDNLLPRYIIISFNYGILSNRNGFSFYVPSFVFIYAKSKFFAAMSRWTTVETSDIFNKME